MSTTNPYQPPEQDSRPPDPAHFWELDGTSLLVRHQGALPPVDLETGATDVAFTAVPRGIQKINIGIFIVAFGVAYMAFGWKALDVSPLVIFICVFLLIFIAKITGHGGKQVVIWEQVESSKARSRKQRGRIRLLLGFLPLFLLIGLPLAATRSSMFLGLIFLVSLIALLTVFVWGRIDRPDTRYALGPEGWMRISGAHIQALSYLRDLQDQREKKAHQPDAPRTKKVAMAYLHRFPLRALLAECHRQPSARFWLTIMHLLRSQKLQMKIHPPSEAEEVDLLGTRAILQEAISAWLKNAVDWTLSRIDRLTTPGKTADNESAFLTSPQLRELLTIQSSQSINQSPDKPVRISFLSRNEEGLYLLTTSETIIPVPNEGTKCQRAVGPPQEIYAQHLKFIASEHLRTAANAEELVSWAIDARQQSFLAMQKAGLYGPTREIAI